MTVAEATDKISNEVRKAIVGQDDKVLQALAAMFADGHVLIESVPGLAKTLIVRSLAATLGLGYGRIQFTPDLMPSDILGTQIFDQKTQEFHLRKGPIFTSVLLADEINRTPPKTQAALLEAMEERQTTIDGVSETLPAPFIVFATQNPIEFEGTYPLPEAQQDRFLLKMVLDYPEQAQEIEVLKRHHAGFTPRKLEDTGIQVAVTPQEWAQLRKEVAEVQIEDKIFDYIYGIVHATRRSQDIQVGASPRAGIALMNCAKAISAMRGRDFVIPDDVKELSIPALRHRVLLRPEAELEGLTPERVLSRLVEAQPVPR